MDKKINFWKFQPTMQAMYLAIFGAIGGVFAYIIAKPYISWATEFGALCALAFYITSCLSAVHKYNSNIEKNIKDREKEH